MALEDEVAAINAVVLSEEEERSIDEALERAKLEFPPVHGLNAAFDVGLRMLVISLSNGSRLAIPQEDLQGVADLLPEEAAHFTLDDLGVGVWWDNIDRGFTIEGLREGYTGNAKWMNALRAARNVAREPQFLKSA